MKLLDKLIEALESGEYKQGREALCNYDRQNKPTGYCCLGVATHLHNPNHKMLMTETNYGGTSLGFYMPADVKERIEKEDPDVRFFRGTTQDSEEYDMYVKLMPGEDEPSVLLSVLNDNGRSFREIAKFIRMTYR